MQIHTRLTGTSVQRLDLTTDFTTAWAQSFVVYSSAKIIRFYWIPSHVGIKVGKGLADQAAKDYINDGASSVPVPYTDRRRHINAFILSKPLGWGPL